MNNIRPIRTAEDLAWAISEVTLYFDNPPLPFTEEADRFDVLSDLIEAYENKITDFKEQDPVDFLKNFMEMTGRTQADLADVLGSRSRASEIINRRRQISIEHIRAIKADWGIPADCLIPGRNIEAA